MQKAFKFSGTVILWTMILSFAGTGGHAQVVSVPDANFKAALIAAGVDKNKDGKIQESEALLVTRLEIGVKDISSLEGIAAFKHLTFLACGSNNLRSIDLSNNTELTDLDCGDDNLTALDISLLVNLKRLICSINKLTALDISHNKLSLLDCSNNQLTELDVSASEMLSTFTCSHNPSLTKIYLAAGITPGTGWIKDASAVWVNKPPVTVTKPSTPVVVDKPPVNTITVTTDPIVSIPDANFKAALIAAGVDKNKDGVIQESEALEVRTIYVDNKSIASLEGIAAFKNLTDLSCVNNKLTNLDVSKNVKLKELTFFSNRLTSIDLSKNEELTTLSCSYNQLTSLDVFNNTKLRHLMCDDNPITFLDASALLSLVSLDCGNNKFTSLDLSKNESLSKLDCTKSPLLTKIYIAPGMTPGADWKKDDTAQWIKK